MARQRYRTASTAVPLVSLALLLLACGGVDNEAIHQQVVEQLPIIEGTELMSTEREGYCLKDSCPLGDDATDTVLTFRHDDEAPTEQELVEIYGALDPEGSQILVCEKLGTDPEFCVSEEDHRASVDLQLGDHSVHVSTLGWSDSGTYVVRISDLRN